MRWASKNTITRLLQSTLLLAVVLIVMSIVTEITLNMLRSYYLSGEQIRFYKHYSNSLNHLRNVDFLKRLPPKYEKKPSNFIFTEIGNGKKTVLFQGDSWAEQFLHTVRSFEKLEGLSRDKNLRLIIAGTGSYSPSLMTVQFRILEEDFRIKPDIVVAIIDQTDIGDELCRYKAQRASNESGKLIIKSFTSEQPQTFNTTHYFKMLEIMDDNKNPLLKVAHIATHLLENKFTKYRNSDVCSWSDISLPLRENLLSHDEEYFSDILGEYIAAVLGDHSLVEKLFMVTHFHRGHVDGSYRTNISELVNKAVSKSKYKSRIVHIETKTSDYTVEELDSLFRQDDVASHLTDDSHSGAYLKRIISHLEHSLR